MGSFLVVEQRTSSLLLHNCVRGCEAVLIQCEEVSAVSKSLLLCDLVSV